MKAQTPTHSRHFWNQALPPVAQWPRHLAGCLGLELAEGPPASAKPRRRRSASAEPVGADEWPRVCGWFGSSHELSCGLLVQELALEDASTALPLVSLSRS